MVVHGMGRGLRFCGIFALGTPLKAQPAELPGEMLCPSNLCEWQPLLVPRGRYRGIADVGSGVRPTCHATISAEEAASPIESIGKHEREAAGTVLRETCLWSLSRLVQGLSTKPSSISVLKPSNRSLSHAKAPALAASPIFVETYLSFMEKNVWSLLLCPCVDTVP